MQEALQEAQRAVMALLDAGGLTPPTDAITWAAALQRRHALACRAWRCLSSAWSQPRISDDEEQLVLLWAAGVQEAYALMVDLLLLAGHARNAALEQWASATADSWAWRLRLTCRLSDAVWQAAAAPVAPQPHPSTSSQPQHACGAPARRPWVLNARQRPLPPATLRALQQAFAPPTHPSSSCCFWAAHRYQDPATPFHSYAFDLSRAPAHVVELAAQQLRRHPALAAPLAGATHVEWWAHCRAVAAGGGEGAGGCLESAHGLHFDCDETRLRQGPDRYLLRHPLWSSVLFLHVPTTTAARHPRAQDAAPAPASGHTQHASGPPQGSARPHLSGPTVVLDQTPQQQGLAGQAWLVHPEPGRFLLFPGDLLHGVLPTSPLQPAAAAAVAGASVAAAAEAPAPPRSCGDGGTQQGAGFEDGCAHRVTLILAWWQHSCLDAGGGSNGEEFAAPSGAGLRPWMIAAAAEEDVAGDSGGERSGKRARRDASAQHGAAAAGDGVPSAWLRRFRRLMDDALGEGEGAAGTGDVGERQEALRAPAAVVPAWAAVPADAPPLFPDLRSPEAVGGGEADVAHGQSRLQGEVGDRTGARMERLPVGVVGRVPLPDLRFVLPDAQHFASLYPPSTAAV